MHAKYICIGEIVKPQGIRGEVKMSAAFSDMSRYTSLETVFLQRGKGEMTEYAVVKGRTYDGFAFLALKGVSDRNQAEALRGYSVYVDRDHAFELDEDTNFVDDLIGLTAVDSRGNVIGELVDVLSPNAYSDVYVFDTPRGEMMMPALRRVVIEVDLDEEKIVLDEEVLAEVAVWEDDDAGEIRE